MAKKQGRWRNTCPRFVAFLDIMGFKDMVFRNGHKEVLKMLKSFRPVISAIESNARYILTVKRTKLSPEEKLYTQTLVRPVSFSDSIILISSDDSPVSAVDIIYNVEWVLKNAIMQGIPIKGAIAFGEQTADFYNSLHIGRPLIDAYELQDELKFYGAILHHTTEKHLIDKKILGILEKSDLIKWSVPMKPGKITHYVVNWTTELGKEKDPLELVNKLYNNVSGNPRLYVDNTVEFLNWLDKKKIKRRHK